MHEMSLVTSLLRIIEEELKNHPRAKLCAVRVRYGALANIVPDAMQFAFEALTEGTALSGAKLEMEEEAVRLRCVCGTLFTPEQKNELLLVPCPVCGQESGHEVESGRELYLDRMEVE